MSVRFGNLLIVVGALLLAYAAMWQLGLAPGSRVTLPAPVALQRTPTAESTVAPVAVAVATATPAAPTPAPARPVIAATATPLPLVHVPPLSAAPDAADRKQEAQLAPAGYAVRLAIPSIKLDTEVKQGSIVQDANGNSAWETLPFVAVHYGDLTALVGARGNAVIA